MNDLYIEIYKMNESHYQHGSRGGPYFALEGGNLVASMY